MSTPTPDESNVTLLFDKEDHTLGNLLRHELLKDPDVLFAGYKVPHPLFRTVEVRVQTVGVPAQESVDNALNGITNDLDDFEKAFNDALTR